MALREYAGAAKRTALVGDITAGSTTITVADATGYPTGATGPFAIALNLGVAAEEKVLVTSRSGNTLIVSSRGYDGTTASAHSSGVSVDHVLTATDIREANVHVNDTSGDPHPQYLNSTEANSAYVAQATNDQMFLPAQLFVTTSGTPSLSNINGIPAWLFDTTTNETVAAVLGRGVVPGHWATMTVEVWWANAGAGAGAVSWVVSALAQGAGDTLGVGGNINGNQAASGQGVIVATTMSSAVAVPPTSDPLLTLRLFRNPQFDPADTLGNDAGLLGVRLVKAS